MRRFAVPFLRDMKSRTLWPLLIAAAFFIVPAARAQQLPTRPTPEQAQAAIRNNPDLQAQIIQRLQASGLTPDQIRARLRAEGYPESLLDAYLPGGSSKGAAT